MGLTIVKDVLIGNGVILSDMTMRRPLTEVEKKIIDEAPKEYGEIAKLAIRLNRNSSTIRSYLERSGRLPFRNVWWSREEVNILTENRYKSAREIQKILKEHGYSRRISGIYDKKQRMNFAVNPDVNGNYSAMMVSQGLGMPHSTVVKWIRRGWLKSQRPGGNLEFMPGLHWIITQKDLRTFLIDYTAHVDYSKADKFFLTDILTGISREKQILRVANHE